jgi:preprotein translocase SecE subunit
MADGPKRKLRPAQTIREKSETAKTVKPKKKSRRSVVFGSIKIPFQKLGKFLNQYKAFRIIAKVLRFIGRIIVPAYLRNSWKEIKLVTWPSRRETYRLTVAVIGFAIIIGAVVASLDYGLTRLFRIIILGH